MDKQEDKGFHELFTKAKDYIDTNIELKKLRLIEQAVLTTSSVIVIGILSILIIMFGLFLSIAMGFYLSYLLESTYAGFFIVAAFYFVLFLIVYLLRDKFIKVPLVNLFIKRIFKLKQK